MFKKLILGVAFAAFTATAVSAKPPTKPVKPTRPPTPASAKPTKPSTPKSGPGTKPMAVKPTSTKTATPRGPKAVPRTTTAGSTITPTVTSPNVPKNPQLVLKLQSRLPAGTDINAAALGFRNQGQFIAAVNASYNQGINFFELKTLMVDRGFSLGQAIKELRPTSTTATQTKPRKR